MPTSSELVRPTTVDELAAALRDATARDRVVGVRGAGTKDRWGAVGRSPDVVIDTSAMSRVIEHAAGDLVVSVEAGVALSTLQDVVRPAGQWLALDPPEPGATIGGIVATAASGPSRLRFGTPRDLLIGITVVLADGTVARSGGKVVKNVAGYDLGKLFTGSFGTLGVIAECTLRLHPVAPARRVVTATLADPAPAVATLLRSTITPTAIEWYAGKLHVVIDSTEDGARAQAGHVADLIGTSEISDTLPAEFGARPWRDGEVALKITHRLSALGPVLGALDDARVSAHAGSGVVWAAFPTTGDVPGRIDELRRVVAAYDGTVVVVDAPADVRATVDMWGPVGGLDVMRRIKAQFDPDGRMNPGRFVGGL